MQAACPQDNFLDFRKSSFKKPLKFFQEMQIQGVLEGMSPCARASVLVRVRARVRPSVFVRVNARVRPSVLVKFRARARPCTSAPVRACAPVRTRVCPLVGWSWMLANWLIH